MDLLLDDNFHLLEIKLFFGSTHILFGLLDAQVSLESLDFEEIHGAFVKVESPESQLELVHRPLKILLCHDEEGIFFMLLPPSIPLILTLLAVRRQGSTRSQTYSNDIEIIYTIHKNYMSIIL